jgi:3-hydroxy acid dehydrogenase/malonic semialdehyde reductase
MKSARKILVTGASSGIGHAITERLLSEGHHVLGLSRHPERQDDGERYTPIALDLSDLRAIQSCIRTLTQAHPDLDAVISNAGDAAIAPLENWSVSAMTEAINLNLTSHMVVARCVFPHLRGHTRSDLVFMASEASHRTTKQGSVYSAAKFGLRGFAQALRQEGATSGVRVSTVLPGFVRTPFFDDLDFEPGPEPNHAIDPQAVADVVFNILSAPPNTVFDEVRLTPLTHVLQKRSRKE